MAARLDNSSDGDWGSGNKFYGPCCPSLFGILLNQVPLQKYNLAWPGGFGNATHLLLQWVSSLLQGVDLDTASSRSNPELHPR